MKATSVRLEVLPHFHLAFFSLDNFTINLSLEHSKGGRSTVVVDESFPSGGTSAQQATYILVNHIHGVLLDVQDPANEYRVSLLSDLIRDAILLLRT